MGVEVYREPERGYSCTVVPGTLKSGARGMLEPRRNLRPSWAKYGDMSLKEE